MNTNKSYWTKIVSVAIILVSVFISSAFAQQGKIVINDDIAAYTPPIYDYKLPVDFENARAMPLPQVNLQPEGPFEASGFVKYPGPPGFEPGSPGNGKMAPGSSRPPFRFSMKRTRESFLKNTEPQPTPSPPPGWIPYPTTSPKTTLTGRQASCTLSRRFKLRLLGFSHQTRRGRNRSALCGGFW